MLILVVDDDPVIRRATARLIRAAGHRSVEADGSEALDLIRQRRPYDLVISDYDMPDVTGVDILNAALAAGLPFVFHTGNVEAVAHTGVTVVPKAGSGDALKQILAEWEAHARQG